MKRFLGTIITIVAAVWVTGTPLAWAYPAPKIHKDQIPAEMPPEIRRHVEALYSPEDSEVVNAINALGAMGPAAAPAAPYLAGVLDTKHPKGPPEAFEALKRIGKASVESVILTLQLGDRYAQNRACDLLAYFRDERAIPALVSAVADGTQNKQATKALAAFGEPALNYIRQGLTDEKPAARSRALLATPSFPQPAVIEQVTKAVGDPDGFVRYSALQALAQMPAGQVKVTDALLAALRDPDPRIRRLALQQVASSGGDQTLDSLVKLLADPDRTTQLSAIASLGAMRTERSAQALADAAAATDPLVRASVADAIAKHGQPAAIPLLAKLRQDPDPSVRQRAVAGLGTIRSPEAVNTLLEALGDNDAMVRTEAVTALGDSPDQRVRDKLGELVEDPDLSVAMQAVAMLARRPPVPVPPMLKALRGSRQPLQLRAVNALGQVNQPDVAAALIQVLTTSKDEALRDQALQALGRQSTLPTLDPIRALLKGADSRATIVAIGILGRLHDTASLDAIVAYLSGQRDVALAAARALDQLQPESIEAMFKALQHPDPDIRDTIARQLERHRDPDIRKRYADFVASLPPTATAATPGKTKPPPTGDAGAPKIARQVVPYYLTMLKSDQPEVRANAAAELGRSGPEAVKPLAEASADPEPAVRVAVARSLGSLGDAAALPVLANLLRDPQPLVRAAAVRALGTFAAPSTVEPLTRALTDTDWHVRWEAADILGRMKNRSASPALQAALKDAHWYVRRAAAEALGKIGDPSAAEALAAAQADSHWYVRQTAAAALKALK